jgi:hypothetical protein
MKTKKCLEFFDTDKPWKQFKSNGTDIVNCPCKHKECQIEIKESTAYRHLKYGIGFKFPSEKARSDMSERDL